MSSTGTVLRGEIGENPHMAIGINAYGTCGIWTPIPRVRRRCERSDIARVSKRNKIKNCTPNERRQVTAVVPGVASRALQNVVRLHPAQLRVPAAVQVPRLDRRVAPGRQPVR